MLNRKKRLLLSKLLSLFSVVRGYNIIIIALAQYLTSIYILAPKLPLSKVIFDVDLFLLVFVSSMVIASGYIINNFYDAEKDLINRPRKSMLDRLVSQQFKLSTYFLLNFGAVLIASYVSFKAVIFFSVYIFGIWLYSHKLKKIVLLGNIISCILAVTPFFAIFIYYKNFETVIFVHATFLFLLLLAKELVKDLENISGDLVQNYKTIPIIYGVEIAKLAITTTVLCALIPSLLLIFKFHIGEMRYYFIGCVFLLVLFLILLQHASFKRQYLKLHFILKLIIVCGVFGILLIDLDLVLNRLL